MRTLALGFPWFGGVRLRAKAVVIGAVALVVGTAHVTQAGVNVWTSNGPYANVTALAVAPTMPSTLYAGTIDTNNGAGVGVYKSADGGGSWSAVYTGFTVYDSSVYALAIDPTTPSTLYVGTYEGVFQSTDSGDSWSYSSVNDYDSSVYALAIDPITHTTLYAGMAGGDVFRSTDGGGTWVNTGLSNNLSSGYRVTALAIDPTTPSTLYAGMLGGGVCESTDSGGSWSAVNAGLPADDSGNISVTALAMDPTTPSTLYAGTDGGVYKSTDSGGTWSYSGLSVYDSSVYALAIDPITHTTLYAGMATPGAYGGGYGGGVFQSTNSGGSWSTVTTGLDPTGLDTTFIYALAIAPTMPSTLYAGTLGGGVFSIQQVGACGGDCNDMPTQTATIMPVATITPTPTSSQRSCVGDCDGSGEATVDELITLVNIDLGILQPSACQHGVPSGAEVDIVLIIQAVNNALNGCAG